MSHNRMQGGRYTQYKCLFGYD